MNPASISRNDNFRGNSTGDGETLAQSAMTKRPPEAIVELQEFINSCRDAREARKALAAKQF